MKIRKLLCILCALSMILALTACNSDQTSTPKGNDNSTGEADDSAFTFQLNGTDCSVYGGKNKLSEYPEPYCSLKKGENLKAGIQTTVSSGLNKQPFYKVWLRNDQETDCAYSDANISSFFMQGGEPGDMVCRGVTFGQTKEEVDKLANEYPNIGYGSNKYESTLRSLLFNKLGENWADQIEEEYYVYPNCGPDGLDCYLYVTFLDGKVYAMAAAAFYY